MAATQPIPSRETLIEHLQAIARTTGQRHVNRREFERRTGFSRYHVFQRFETYGAFLRAAGLVEAKNAHLDDDTLLRALRDACLAAGGAVSALKVRRHGGRSASAYIRRWGIWRNALVALRDWIETHDPDFPYLAALPTGGPDARPCLLPKPVAAPRYGAPINFRGILHEPINEAGVVMLFGAMAQDLGFAVERVVSAFPDCEAKRRTAEGWQRARIEFEFESGNFLKHGHDPAGCDLIVCWEHNWTECPVEVLELRAEVVKRSAGRLGTNAAA